MTVHFITFFILLFCLHEIFAGSKRRNETLWTIKSPSLLTRWSNAMFTSNHMIKKPLPEYPRPQLVRKSWLNLNGIWSVSLDSGDTQRKIMVPFAIESALSGIVNNVTSNFTVVYQRTFVVPRRWKDRNILLHFGAIDWDAQVFVNDQLVGEHQGGYSSFTIDITAALLPSTQQSVSLPLKRQKLLVEVRDPTDAGPQPRGKQVRDPHKIWYTSVTGIWQTVWLEMLPRLVSIRQLSIVPRYDESMVAFTTMLQSDTNIDGEEIPVVPHAFVLSISIYSNKNIVQQVDQIVSFVTSNETTNHRQRQFETLVPLTDFISWSPNNPHLYNVRIVVKKIESVSIIDPYSKELNEIDEITSYFGMRKISIERMNSSDFTKIYLNNQPYFQMGLLDQGFWPDGLYTAPTDDALKYDIEISKKLGFNMIRKHVKVEPDRWYYWCDVLGMLVWQDMPSGDQETARYVGPDITRSDNSKTIFYREWKEIMTQLMNHPCIVVWVPFNEGWGQFETTEVTAFTKSIDNSRLVDAVSGWIDRQTGDIIDVHNYPAPIAPKPEIGRASVLGEYGGLGLYVPKHSWATAMPSWSYKKITNSSDLTKEFLKLLSIVHTLRDQKGLSAAIYTQTTDVEGEVNGIMTYDREIVKLEITTVQKALQNVTGFH